MTSKEFLCYVAASYPILWVDTQEYERAILNLSNSVKKLEHKCFKWDVLSGVTEIKSGKNAETSADDPEQPINFVSGKEKNVIFVQDYHLFIKSQQIWRRILNELPNLKAHANIIVIVSPVVEIPPEIDRYVTVMDFNLPDRAELEEKFNEICQDMEIDIPENKEEIISCGLGLTEFEFENSVCKSIAQTGAVVAKSIYEQKEQLIRKNATLAVTKFDGGFETLEGLDSLKGFTKKMVGQGRGVLLLGVPGGGKSHFAKTLGKETGRITISLDFGNLMGGIVGETERKTREALKVIDTMEPAILFIDEIEKGLAGVSGHNGDSGTSQRQGGQFLKWMNDHTSDVYVVATSNNIDKLPPEFLRAERWDAIFFVDIPNEVEKNAILQLYMNQFELTEQELPDMTNWTGAEIKTLCKLSNNLGVSMLEASAYVCPIYKTMEEKIKHLRDWAKDRTIPASKVVPLEAQAAKTRKRNIQTVGEVG